MEIGKQIAYYRKKKGLSQEELATTAGLASKTVVSGIESGIRNPSVKTLQLIAGVLDCEVSIKLMLKKKAPGAKK